MKYKMSLSINMRGLQKYHKRNPRKSLRGYLICNGRELSHDEVVKVMDYAVEHGYETEKNIPKNELVELLKSK